MKRKEYEGEMRRLHGELVAMQEWVKASGAKICIVFEGRDTAGKGGTIKRITERVSPRVFRVVALPAPTEREKSQMYVQRYIQHFPAAGEVVIFDRSWYNRAGVERVMGFCTPEQTERFLEQVPAVEKAMVDSGILLLKYWLEVGPDEQTRRLESRIDDPRKIWKLSDMDLKSYSRWYDYSRARDAMFAATDTAWAPWYVAHTDDKKRGSAQHHQPPAQPGPVRAARAPGRHASQAAAGRRLRRAGPAAAVHPDAVLTEESMDTTTAGESDRSRSATAHPVVRRILADEAVHRLADEVGMAHVSRVLLDQIDQHPPQVGCLAAGVADARGQVIHATVGQRIAERGARAGHGAAPERHELLGGVLGGRSPFPVRVGVPVHRVPRGSDLPPEQPAAGVVVLDEGQVLEQPSQGDRRGGDPHLEPCRVESPALPLHERAHALEGAQERGCLVARERGLRVGHSRLPVSLTPGALAPWARA